MNRIRYIRTSRGWSQAALARMAGLHQATVCTIETGRMVPYRGQLEKIAAALGWTGDPAELLEEAGNDERARV